MNDDDNILNREHERIIAVKKTCLNHGVDWLDNSKTVILTMLDLVECVIALMDRVKKLETMVKNKEECCE